MNLGWPWKYDRTLHSDMVAVYPKKEQVFGMARENVIQKKIYEAAENVFKEKVLGELSRPGCENVTAIFSGSAENNDLNVDFTGPEDEVAAAKRRLKNIS